MLFQERKIPSKDKIKVLLILSGIKSLDIILLRWIDNIDYINKNKYLVPIDLTLGQFVFVIRRRLKLDPSKAIFLFIGNIIPPTASLMMTLYDEYKDNDGFLYIKYSGENTFGN